jgi:hypothetical protein
MLLVCAPESFEEETCLEDNPNMHNSTPNLESEYKFKESVWDAALFIGSPSIGCAGSLLLTVVLFCNAVDPYFRGDH